MVDPKHFDSPVSTRHAPEVTRSTLKKIWSVDDCYDVVVDALTQDPHCFLVVPDPTSKGVIPGIRFFTTRKVKFRHFKGLTVPSNFRVLREVDSNTQHKKLRKSIQEIVDIYGGECKKKLWAFWRPIIELQHGKEEAPVFEMIRQRGKENDGHALTCRIEPRAIPENSQPDDLNSLAVAVLPLKEWFDPKLHSLTIEDILGCLFEQPEARILALQLGRIVVGPSGYCPPSWGETAVTHTSRLSSVVVGPPGVGKSTLFEHLLKPALQSLGYHVASAVGIGSKYSAIEYVGSNLTYSDDTSTEEIKKWASSGLTKAIITNSPVQLERKYRDPVQVKPITTFLLNANEFDHKLAWSIDEGMAARVAALEVRSHRVNPGKHFAELADQYEVDPQVIPLWLLRLCGDYFLEYTQHPFGDDLKAEVYKWKNQLKIDFSPVTNQQILATLLSIELVLSELFPDRDNLNLSAPLGFRNARHSLNAMVAVGLNKTIVKCYNDHWESTGFASNTHPAKTFSVLDWRTAKRWEKEHGRTVIDSGVDPYPVYQSFAEEVSTLLGVELDKSKTRLFKAWSAVIKDMDGIKSVADNLILATKNNPNLKSGWGFVNDCKNKVPTND